MSDTRTVRITINGSVHEAEVEPRRTLADFIREDAGLKGTHLACEHGFCGNCNVAFDGDTIRSCLMFAVQADGSEVRTVEALDEGWDGLHPLQQAFHEKHGLQCGFCTPGFLMSIEPLLLEEREMSDREIREALAGNLCRCTGYQNIVEAVKLARERVREPAASPVD
jgi:aerobic-type carbon monoxide dehydrogenase small subunit (CoxS/CutS family)